MKVKIATQRVIQGNIWDNIFLNMILKIIPTCIDIDNNNLGDNQNQSTNEQKQTLTSKPRGRLDQANVISNSKFMQISRFIFCFDLQPI